jgi:hypothetical protein
MKISRWFGFVLVYALAVVPSSSFGWGKYAHESIEVVANQMMPPSSLSRLLTNNITAVRFMAMVPDVSWKHGPNAHPLEAHTHFFEIEYYLKNINPIPRDFNLLLSRVGQDNILNAGSAPYRAAQMAGLLTKTMQNPQSNPQDIIILAATLGHYIGDLSQPLHVVEDYDGQMAGVKGLHSFFETKSVQLISEPELLQAVYSEGMKVQQQLPEMPDTFDTALKLANVSAQRAPMLLTMAKESGNGLSKQLSEAYRPMIFQTMGNGSAVLARIWNAAWVAAGRPQISEANVGFIKTPNWVPLDYMH